MENAVVGVRFQEAGKIYYFEPGGYDELSVGNYVVVETSRGLELGRVVIAPGQVLSAELTEPLKPIVRIAGPEDIDRADELKQRAREATALARERARILDLPMKVVSSQYTLDGSRLTIFFTSESRVDFRDLVRDLGHHVRAQVQLRQIGPRDQSKVIGGYGRCGRRLCCTSWLTAFPAISIKMAKEQNLPLNPSKISGQCGRLLCCLSYENDVYKHLKSELPKPDSWLSTPTGTARVVAVNVIKQIVMLQMENFQVVEFTVEQLGFGRGIARPIEAGEAAVPPPDINAVPSTIEGSNGDLATADVRRFGDGIAPAPTGGAENRSPAQRGAQPRRGEARNGAAGPMPTPGLQSQRNRGQPTARSQATEFPSPAQAPSLPSQQSGDPHLHSELAPDGAPDSGEGVARKRRRRRHRGGAKPA
jgi:cell fate regulator YaaT (PSP1 superfamily)